ncbi:uncharacterized protein DS421_20g699910 [Arachis hypogaea]|nr:uncharacterized protein DS421_20g699910 [Arachis hypogaea]
MNPSPPSSPPFPGSQRRRRSQVLSTATSSSSPCPEPSNLAVRGLALSCSSASCFPVIRLTSVASLFCWLEATCCRIAARRHLPGSRRLPGRRPCLHQRFSVIRDYLLLLKFQV